MPLHLIKLCVGADSVKDLEGKSIAISTGAVAPRRKPVEPAGAATCGTSRAGAKVGVVSTPLSPAQPARAAVTSRATVNRFTG